MEKWGKCGTDFIWNFHFIGFSFSLLSYETESDICWSWIPVPSILFSKVSYSPQAWTAMQDWFSECVMASDAQAVRAKILLQHHITKQRMGNGYTYLFKPHGYHLALRRPWLPLSSNMILLLIEIVVATVFRHTVAFFPVLSNLPHSSHK